MHYCITMTHALVRAYYNMDTVPHGEANVTYVEQNGWMVVKLQCTDCVCLFGALAVLLWRGQGGGLSGAVAVVVHRCGCALKGFLLSFPEIKSRGQLARQTRHFCLGLFSRILRPALIPEP